MAVGGFAGGMAGGNMARPARRRAPATYERGSQPTTTGAVTNTATPIGGQPATPRPIIQLPNPSGPGSRRAPTGGVAVGPGVISQPPPGPGGTGGGGIQDIIRRMFGGGGAGGWMGGPGGGGGVGGGGAMTVPGGTTVEAQIDPRLEALQRRYTDWLGQYEQGTGYAADVAGQKAQESLMGGRKMMEEQAALTGRPIDETRYAAEIAKAGAAGSSAEALRRQEQLGEAIRGGLPLAGAPGEAMRAERGLGLEARGQDIQAQIAQAQLAQSQLSQFLQLLQAMGGFG